MTLREWISYLQAIERAIAAKDRRDQLKDQVARELLPRLTPALLEGFTKLLAEKPDPAEIAAVARSIALVPWPTALDALAVELVDQKVEEWRRYKAALRERVELGISSRAIDGR